MDILPVYLTKGNRMSFNSRARKILISAVLQKEREIENAKLFCGSALIDSLRDELESLNKKAQAEMGGLDALLKQEGEGATDAPVEEAPIGDEMETAPDEGKINSPIPKSPEDLENILSDSISDMYLLGPNGDGKILLENGEPAFSVNKVYDPTTGDIQQIRVESNIAKNPEYQEIGDKDPSDFWQFEPGNYTKNVMSLISTGPENFAPFDFESGENGEITTIENTKKLRDMADQLVEAYKGAIGEVRAGKNGSSLIYVYPADIGERNKQLDILSRLYDLLEKAGVAGPKAYNKDVMREEIDDDNQEEAIQPPAINAHCKEKKIMASKKFNLKKFADKVFDSIREVPLEKTNEHYQELHQKALPEYDEAYTSEKDFRENVMDKYYREYIGDDGEYHGGYINDRFVVHHNSEGNSNHIKPNERSGPDRTESYSTERRLEEMRANNKRGLYEFSDPETSRRKAPATEKQTKDVLASISVVEEQGLFRVRSGDKVTYLDTESQVQTFSEILSDIRSESKKKIKKAESLNPQSVANPFDGLIGDINAFLLSDEATAPGAYENLRDKVISVRANAMATMNFTHDDIVAFDNEIFTKLATEPTEEQFKQLFSLFPTENNESEGSIDLDMDF